MKAWSFAVFYVCTLDLSTHSVKLVHSCSSRQFCLYNPSTRSKTKRKITAYMLIVCNTMNTLHFFTIYCRFVKRKEIYDSIQHTAQYKLLFYAKTNSLLPTLRVRWKQAPAIRCNLPRHVTTAETSGMHESSCDRWTTSAYEINHNLINMMPTKRNVSLYYSMHRV